MTQQHESPQVGRRASTPATLLDLSESDELVDEREVARRFGLTVHAIRRRRERGQAPAYHRIGRSIRYNLRDVERFIAECRVVPRRG